MTLLVDTSGLLAMADAGAAEHDAIRRLVTTTRDALLVPVTVLPEVDYLATRRYGLRVALAILRATSAGRFQRLDLTTDDLERSIALIEQYADANIGLVDATIVALAERLRITRILTLDRRHFRMLRPRHCPAFELLP